MSGVQNEEQKRALKIPSTVHGVGSPPGLLHHVTATVDLAEQEADVNRKEMQCLSQPVGCSVSILNEQWMSGGWDSLCFLFLIVSFCEERLL